ncbi:chromosomal replication initiator protein DnaA [Planctomycetota bacterium]
MHSMITDEHSDTQQSKTDAISHALVELLGAQRYRIWFKESTQLTLSDDCLRIAVPNAFTANWIESHFVKDIRRATETALGECPRITFSITQDRASRKVASRPTTPPVQSRLAARTAATAPSSKPKDPKLRLTLESFVVGPSNELAFSAAKAVVQEQRSPFNPLFIHGGYGVGKTHLLQGLCREITTRRPQTRWQNLSAEDFANQFVLALKTKKLEVFRQRMRRLDLLAIDDIHFLANKPSTQEEFLHTFNTISLAGKQVVLVSDASPKMIGQLSDKLVNRFVSGMVVKIDPPDFATRCEICRRRAVNMVRTAFAGRLSNPKQTPDVPEEVVRYIAEHVRSNARELEGALLKVIAFSALQNEKLSLSTAQSVLADHVEHCDPMIRIADIESAVASYFGTTAANIHSARKDKTVALARHYSMYLARKHTNMSSSEVGRLMGNKNHATVLVACKRVEELVQRDADINWRSPAGNKVAKARQVLEQLETTLAQG